MALAISNCSLRSRHCRLGGRHLGFGDPIATGRLVDVLLREKARPRVHDARQSGRSQMRDLVRRLGSVEIGLRAPYFFLGLPYCGLVLPQLVLQFGNFEHRQQLAALDAIADVNRDCLEIAGDFGVDLDFLERPERRGHLEHLPDVAATDSGGGDRRSFVLRPVGRLRVVPGTSGGCAQRDDRHERRCEKCLVIRDASAIVRSASKRKLW